MENIKDSSILKYLLNDNEYIFNIQDKENYFITLEVIKYGEWYIYTWAY